MRNCAVFLFLVLAGCGGYGDFTLPVLSGGNPNTSFRFQEQPEPVLKRGGFHDVLNPSVVDRVMLYSAYDGQSWRTFNAVSDDAVHWRELGAILSPDPHTWEGSYIAANGAVARNGSELLYWYVAGPKDLPRLGLARSKSGGTWVKEAKPVLDPGPYMSWDECGVADPYVVRIGPYFYLYYLGQDRARPTRQRIGVARSRDGIGWEKLRSNPLLEIGEPGAFDEAGLGEPAVWSYGGFYWMLYTGRDFQENRRLGLARSTDGVHWTKQAPVIAGSSAWDSKVICDPTVQVAGSEIRVWFGGGDVARPDEDLHGQIGYGTLTSVDATLAK